MHLFVPQVSVIDEGGLHSNLTLISLTILLLDDEPPEITGTNFNQTYTEENGTIDIIDGNVTIVDSDNCVDHMVVVRLRVELLVPLEEDILIANGTQVNSTLEYSCAEPRCYEAFLVSLQYNNSNPEPSTKNREIIIQVGSKHGTVLVDQVGSKHGTVLVDQVGSKHGTVR